MALSDVYAYFRNYDKQTFAVFAQQGNEPSAREVAAFETRIGFRFPEEFREFAVHQLGGLYMEVKEEFWPRAKAYDVGPFWSFLYGLYVYSLSSEAPEILQMDEGYKSFAEANGAGLVPFLKVLGNADPYCFTPEGGIVSWQHEDPDNPEPVDGSFSEVLMREIRALEERAQRKIRGEDRQ